MEARRDSLCRPSERWTIIYIWITADAPGNSAEMMCSASVAARPPFCNRVIEQIKTGWDKGSFHMENSTTINK